MAQKLPVPLVSLPNILRPVLRVQLPTITSVAVIVPGDVCLQLIAIFHATAAWGSHTALPHKA